jgi:hypothetical protein
MQPTRRELYTLNINVAAGTTELAVSERIHQPFRVDAISFSTGNILQGGQAVNLFTEDRDGGAASALDRLRRGLFVGTNEVGTTLDAQGLTTGAADMVGRIVRDVPTRLVLIGTNPAASALDISAHVSVTFLSPLPDRLPEPE